MFNFKVLQEEQVPWVKHNFGDRPSWMPLMGLIEEYGELYVAEDSKHIEEIVDALADMTIFLSDYCSSLKLDMQKLWEEKHTCADKVNRVFQVVLGRLAHSHLKSEQNIRISENHNEASQQAIRDILYLLEQRCHSYGFDLLEETERIWAKVKKRDWKADPSKAGNNS